MNPEQKSLEEATPESDSPETHFFDNVRSQIDHVAHGLRKLFVIGGLLLPVSAVACAQPQKPPATVQHNEVYDRERIEAEINAAVTLKYIECDESHPEKPCAEKVLIDTDKLSPQLKEKVQIFSFFVPFALKLGQRQEKKIFIPGTVTSLDIDIEREEYFRKHVFITSGQPQNVKTDKGDVLATPITIKFTYPCSGFIFNITGLQDGKPMKFRVKDTSVCISG